jgi:putative hydrolase of the HAD superfamily
MNAPSPTHIAAGFAHIDAWVFDLDNTLYPSHCDLFAQIDQKMRAFISQFLDMSEDEAGLLQKQYYRDHGTTLSGLMTVHGMEPKAFLDFVHDIDLAPVRPDPRLAQAMMRLPGRKLVFTNGTVHHAERVMAQLGVRQAVDGVFDIVHADYVPKPRIETFRRFCSAHDVAPGSAAMFEDLARNLAPAHELGMTTVLVEPPAGHADPTVRGWGDAREGAHIHYRTSDLAEFLESVLLESTS